jgi:hypothetical protein
MIIPESSDSEKHTLYRLTLYVYLKSKQDQILYKQDGRNLQNKCDDISSMT